MTSPHARYRSLPDAAPTLRYPEYPQGVGRICKAAEAATAAHGALTSLGAALREAA